MARRSLIEYLETFPRRSGDIAYVQPQGYRTTRWPYRRVYDVSCQFARELEARGIGPGDCLLLWGRNSAEWVAAFWGSLARGVVAVPMDNIAAPDFAGRVARQVRAQLLVSTREHAELDPTLPVILLEELPEIVARHRVQAPVTLTINRETPAEIVFTSGTTAEPKGVVITHGNILANLEPLEQEIRNYLKYERFFHPIRFLNLLPLSHVFGQFLGIFVPPLLGGAVYLTPSLNPSEILRMIRRERISVLVAVPRLLESLGEKLERDLEAAGRLDWYRAQLQAVEGERFWKRMWRFRRIHRQLGWRFWALISGGAALPSETELFWDRLGFAVIQGYGLTETTSLVSLNHPFRLGKGSIGKALPGCEIRLEADGEILVRGENVAQAFWRGEAARPEMGEEDGGWFHTGDLGALDEHGNLYFKGRKKNVIVTSAGLNVYPEDLEAALRRQPEVRDCVVIALEREGNAEPCAVLLLRPGSDPQTIIQRANRELAEFQHIRRWHLWQSEDFPRTSTQKPRLPAIIEAVRAQMGAGAAGGGLAELIRHVTGRNDLTLSPDAHLGADLNLNSIDRVELMSAIEDRYQVDLDESEFAAATTLGQLEQSLREPAIRRADYVYPRWAQRWPVTWLRFLVYYLLVWPATMLLACPSVRGRENLRRARGPLLIVANHTTRSDIGFIQAALPLRLRHRLGVAMEGERLRAMRNPRAELGFFQRWLARLQYVLVVALFNVFPLPKQSGFRESFAFAGELVDRNYSVVVFPEGELTRDGTMGWFRAGVGLLALNLQVPVVPIRIEGLFALKQAGRKWARPGTVKVTIGVPVEFAADADPQEIARELETRVKSLGSGSQPSSAPRS